MARIPPITSDNRPSSPVQGEVYYESDTNRIIVYDGVVWHVYNRDSLINSTGGVDDLHYPQGLYADPTANYYIASSPAVHMDAHHINGLSINSGFSHGDYITDWNDRTNNNYNMKSNRYHVQEISHSASVHHNQFDLNISSTLSGGECSMPAVYNSTHDRFDFDPAAPQSITTENTIFYIAAGSGNVSPFNNYSWWYRDSVASTMNHISTYNSGYGYTLSHRPRFVSNFNLGPHLTIGRQDSSTAYLWDTELGGSPLVGSHSSSAAALAVNTIFRSSYEMRIWEVIIFHEALDISEINTVKDYLQNKYAGISASLPLAGTPALTAP